MHLRPFRLQAATPLMLSPSLLLKLAAPTRTILSPPHNRSTPYARTLRQTQAAQPARRPWRLPCSLGRCTLGCTPPRAGLCCARQGPTAPTSSWGLLLLSWAAGRQGRRGRGRQQERSRRWARGAGRGRRPSRQCSGGGGDIWGPVGGQGLHAPCTMHHAPCIVSKMHHAPPASGCAPRPPAQASWPMTARTGAAVPLWAAPPPPPPPLRPQGLHPPGRGRGGHHAGAGGAAAGPHAAPGAPRWS